MKTDMITISSSGRNMEAALGLPEKVAVFNALSAKGALHLQVETVIDEGMRKQLLAASSSGRNEASRGLMGRLREFFFRGVDDEIASFKNPLLNSGSTTGNALPQTDWQWSLLLYQNSLSSMKEDDPAAADAWDELEKSVVGHVADDVKISIKDWQTEMTIIKKIA